MKNKGNSAVKTGDSANIAVYAFVILAGATGIVSVLKKRKGRFEK